MLHRATMDNFESSENKRNLSTMFVDLPVFAWDEIMEAATDN